MARDATRRRVLTAAAVTLPLLAAGCKGIAALGTPPKAAPDVAVARDAIAVETQLIAALRRGTGRAARRWPATLRPLLAQHHDHLAQLRARLIIPAGQPAACGVTRCEGPPRGARCRARRRPRSASCGTPRTPRPARCWRT